MIFFFWSLYTFVDERISSLNIYFCYLLNETYINRYDIQQFQIKMIYIKSFVSSI